MRIIQLQYLVEIADSGSFTTAAERLHVAQPSISQAVSSLESELGVTLLTRSRMGAEPTPIGLLVIDHARKVLEELNEITNVVQSNCSDNCVISIVAGSAPIATFLPEAIAAVDPSLHNGSVKLREGSSRMAEQLLLKGEIDFAVVPYVNGPELNNLSFTPLIVAHMMALVSKSHPLASKKHVTFRDIQPYPLTVGNEEYSSSTCALNRIREFGDPHVLLKTQNISLVKSQVKRSNTVGLVFDLSFLDVGPFSLDKSLVLLPIEDSIALTFGILSKQKRVQPLLSKRLMNKLIKIAPEYQEMLDQKNLHD